ncbi:flagellar protein FlaG [Bacillus nitroreducens]
MSIDKISSNTAMNFNLDYSLSNKKYETETHNNKVEGMREKEFVSTYQIDSKENIKQVIDSLNKFLEPNNTSLKFELHEDLNEYYVTIVNNDTHEVVREIPSKKILDIYAAMTEFLGFVVDKKI